MKRTLLLLLLMTACGDDDDGPATVYDAPLSAAFDAPGAPSFDAPPAPSFDGPVFTSGCSITLTGAATGTFPCTVTAGKSDDKSFSVFGLSSSAGQTSIVISLQIDGTLAVGTATASMGTAQVTTDSEIFLATKGSDQDVGTIDPLHITGLTTLPPTPGATIWSVHGTLTATLTSLTTGTSMATLSATF